MSTTDLSQPNRTQAAACKHHPLGTVKRAGRWIRHTLGQRSLALDRVEARPAVCEGNSVTTIAVDRGQTFLPGSL